MKRNNNNKQRRTRRSAAAKPSNKAGVSVFNPPVVRYSPSVFGFPNRLMTKLRYCDLVSTVSTVGSLASNVFRWNSTFDPDVTNVGHQPLFRDTYAGVYDQYAVVSATFKATAINVSTGVSVLCGVITDDDNTLSTTFQTLMEQSNGESRLITPLAGDNSSTTFVRTWDCREVLNIDPYSSQTYKTAVGSNPTESSTISVWSIPQDGTSTLTVQWKIELVQDVLWTELTTPTQS